MNRTLSLTLGAAILSCLLVAPSQAAGPHYRWSFIDANNGQIASYTVGSGTITVASVRTVNTCQTPFFVPERSKFVYDLKMRTAGLIFCGQIVRDRLIAFYEAGTSALVHVKTASGDVTLHPLPLPMRPPLP